MTMVTAIAQVHIQAINVILALKENILSHLVTKIVTVPQLILLMEVMYVIIQVTALVLLDSMGTNAKMSVPAVLLQTLPAALMIHVIVWQDILEEPVKMNAVNVMLIMLKPVLGQLLLIVLVNLDIATQMDVKLICVLNVTKMVSGHVMIQLVFANLDTMELIVARNVSAATKKE